MVKFEAELWQTGNSYVVTVPAAYIKNKLVHLGVKYTFEVEIDAE